jgi:hypothetical protein
MSLTDADKTYDKCIADAERQIRRIEKWLSDAKADSDETQMDVWKWLKRVWEEHVVLLKEVKKMKRNFQIFDTDLLSGVVRKALVEMGYTPNAQVTIGGVKADFLAENQEENKRLLVEVKGLNDQVRCNQLCRYEDASIIQNPLLDTKVILVLPVTDGENFAVWGIKQLIQNKPSM